MLTLRSYFFALTLLCAAASPILAGPNDEDLHAMLIWSNVEETKPLYDEVTAGYKTQLAAVLKYSKSNRPNKLKALGKTQSEILILRRLCRRLVPTGEPGAHDVNIRLAEIRDHMWTLISQSHTLPASGKLVAQIDNSMKAFNAKMAKVEASAQKALANGDWEKAEADIEKFRRDTEHLTTMTGQGFHLRYDPIKDEESKAQAGREQAMRALGATAFAKARNEALPNYTATMQELGSGVQAIGSTGTVTIEGNAMTGPQFVRLCSTRWVTTQLQALRGRGYEWARMSAMNQYEDTPESKKINADYSQYSAAMKELIVKLIQADTQRVAEAEVQTLYPQYVAAVGALSSRIPDPAFHDALDNALTQLSNKSIPVAEQVVAFKSSTDELLRWKAKATAEAASAKKSGSSSIEGAYYKALAAQQAFRGIYQNKRSTAFASLSMSSNHIMQKATQEMLKKRVHRTGWVGSSSGKAAFAAYDSRTWGVFVQPTAVDQAAANFQSELLLSEAAPPLSLRVAEATASAAQRDWEAVGGTVTHVSMETLICQFATLSDKAGNFAQLDTLPKEEIQGPTTRQLTLRADIEPTWLQHKYYLVDLTQ